MMSSFTVLRELGATSMMVLPILFLLYYWGLQQRY